MLNKINMRLRKADFRDVEMLTAWVTKPDFLRNLFPFSSNPDVAKRQLYTMIMTSNAEPSNNILLIAETVRPVALVLFNKIDLRNRNSYWSFVLGEEELKNKVFGMKIIVETLYFAFKYLNLHKLLGCIYEDNTRMIRLLEYFNIKKEGRLRDYDIQNGEHRAAIIYSFFEQDYEGFMANLRDKGIL